MSDFQVQVEDAILRHKLLRQSQPVLVAASGGLDSMVLLRVLGQLSQRHRWRLVIAHLNHQLRGASSAADERLVRRTAAELGLPVVVERAQVRAFGREHRLSLEMAARQVRHEFLARTAKKLAVPTIALAHHADDQLELFFLRLLRGSGGEGLAGMKWRSPSPANACLQLVRPLLAQPKAALRDYAAQQQIRFREDASNAWLDIQRNRLRHHLLPLLQRRYQPALDKVLLRTMDIIGAESEVVTDLARAWLRRKPGAVLLGLPKSCSDQLSTRFGELPLALQRRVLQLELLDLGVAPDYQLVENLRTHPNHPVCISLGKISQERWTCALPHLSASSISASPSRGPVQQAIVRDTMGSLRLQPTGRPRFESGALEIELTDRAGEAAFGGVTVRWRFLGQKGAKRPRPTAGKELFDADRVGSPIVLRFWQAGDRFQPIGMDSAVKLQDFFTNQRVPCSQRYGRIVAATAQGELFWVEGQRIAERFKLTKTTTRRLQWGWQRL